MKDITFNIWSNKEKRMLKPEEICRLHFDEGKCYAVLTWEGTLYFKKDFTISINEGE